MATAPSDLVFASPFQGGKGGKLPYNPDAIQHNHLRFAGEDIGFVTVSHGLVDNLGWHTFRQTYETLLDDTGAPYKVQQRLMRHAEGSMETLKYGEAIDASVRKANAQVVNRLMLNVDQPQPNQLNYSPAYQWSSDSFRCSLLPRRSHRLSGDLRFTIGALFNDEVAITPLAFLLSRGGGIEHCRESEARWRQTSRRSAVGDGGWTPLKPSPPRSHPKRRKPRAIVQSLLPCRLYTSSIHRTRTELSLESLSGSCCLFIAMCT